MDINPTIASQIIVGLILAGIVWERVGRISGRLDRLGDTVSEGQSDIRDTIGDIRDRLDTQNNRLTDLEREMERRKGIQEGIKQMRRGRDDASG